ncbi:DUF2497 domain-containing protein [Sphingopyxis sp.]|uniref:DUF2497 domain-containing protein n=1 Tax=Sphingopyxis sp. TaxID=1908224 RepID=UPI003BA91D59
MEDILSSIRRVIARDEAPGAREKLLATESDDVLDLDEQESEDDAVPEIPTEEELVSAASADAARQSLDALTAAVAPAVAAAAPSPAGGRSMEEVVLDALRPMLKDWLDTNLPSMVEAMVAKEISRITGNRF